MDVNLYEVRLNDYKIPILEKKKSFWRTEDAIQNSDQAYHLLEDTVRLSKFADERVYLIAIDTKCKVRGIFEVSHGTDNACLFPVKEILRACILCGGTAMIIAHNHPTGDVTPSDLDLSQTKAIIKATKTVGLQCMDHIIHGCSIYTSMKDEHIGGFK